MPDEIDVLRWFRADVADPDDAAWNRATAALAEAEEDTGACMVTRAGPQRRSWRAPGRRWRAPGHRLTIAGITAIGAAAAAALVVVVVHSPPTLTRPLTSAWQPARPLPGSGHPLRAAPGTWRLTSYLVARGWQENTAGPEPGLLTCPTAATCYVEGDNSHSSSGPADMNSLYVSTDGAQTWSVLPVPDGVTFTSALSCDSVTDCAAGGLYYGHQAVYLTTFTGGHSWTVRPLAADVGQIASLNCVTAMTCRGLATLSAQAMTYGFGIGPGMHFVVTSDAGRRFTVAQFPAGDSIQSLACPTASHCVAIGWHSRFSSRNGPDFGHGVLLTSDDGGLQWRAHAWPHGYGINPVPDVTCADASHCAMIGFIERSGREVSPGIGYTSGKDGIQYTLIAFSADGGATWTASPFPSKFPYPMIDTLTCPSAAKCYAAGSEDVEQRIGKTRNASSAVVAVTEDAGRTWQRVTFAVPAKVPGGMQGDSFMEIGQIECPSPHACVAFGTSDQGSSSTPIYTYHG